MNLPVAIKKLLPKTFFIGVTGHIDLLENKKLIQQVEEILIQIKTKHKKITLLCLGAKKADQLAANIAARLGIEIAGVYLVDYQCDKEHLQDFKPNQEWLDSQENQPGFKKFNLSDNSFEEKLRKAKQNSNKEKREAEFKTIVQDIHAENAKLIAGRSDYIIALWDGVDNGKTGGTSETVHIALHQKDFKGQCVTFTKRKKGIFNEEELKHWKKTWLKPKGRLYQIVSPREKNRFPLGRFPASHGKGVPNAEIYETGMTPFPLVSFKGNRWQRTWINVKNAYHDGLFLHYLLPALFALLTVGLGSFGFKNLRHFEEWKKDSTNTDGFVTILRQFKKSNAKIKEAEINDQLINSYSWNYHNSVCWPQTNDFFKAINLLTFGSSADINPEKVPLKLTIARWTGLLFVLNAFFIAYLLATSKNNKIKVKVFWWAFWKKHFYVLCGLNEKSYSLGKDLKRQGKSVVIIDGEPDANKMVEAEKKGILVYKANSYSAVALFKVKVANAEKVFLLHEDDVNNIRTLQELAQLKSTRLKRKTKRLAEKDRYIHLSDSRYKDFVCKTHPDTDDTSFHVFNIYENTARRLLLKYPVYRFKGDESAETAEVFVFGFGEMAEQILLSCLRSGFYTKGKKLRITVFTGNHKEKAEQFYKRYPALWYNKELNHVYEKPFAEKIRSEIFQKEVLSFQELPLSDAAYFSDKTIYNAITDKHVVSIYFCLSQSMQSAAYLHAILPKIQHLQGQVLSVTPQCDVQCFCHYNLYDKDEVQYVEHIVNAQIPNSPVVFFGSLTDECTEEAITSRSEDLLPKLINVWHNRDKIIDDDGKQKDTNKLYEERKEFWLERENGDKNINDLEQEAKHSWKRLSIPKKESNRYAADHLWVKLYLLDFTYQTMSKMVREKAVFEQFVKKFTEVSTSRYCAKIAEISRVEHHRWCAEKLLEGFLPAQDFDTALATDHAQAVSRWNTDTNYQNYYQDQKLHIDLLPFDELFSGFYYEKTYNEKIKDVSLIESIPWLIYALHNE